MVKETLKARAMAKPAAGASRSVKTEPHLDTKKQKKHKKFEQPILCFLCLFVASSFLRGGFSFLFFVETFLIFLNPRFKIVRGFLELVAVQQPASQGLEEGARANVVGEFFVGFHIGAFSD